uniref:Uncharacterized protein n=1 Tax=Rhipicephalus zambeziensis TaxID=60191 RepID=A0A224YAP5_9ACAR
MKQLTHCVEECARNVHSKHSTLTFVPHKNFRVSAPKTRMSHKAQAVVQLRLCSSVCCGLSKNCNVYFCFAFLLVAVKSCTLLWNLLHRLQAEQESAPCTTKKFLPNFCNCRVKQKNLREISTSLIYDLVDKKQVLRATS